MTQLSIESTTHVRKAFIVLLAMAVLVGFGPIPASGAVEENIKVPLAGDVFPPFCGEPLEHTGGYLHIKFTFTENAERVSGTAHFQPQGAKLIGLDSGAEYVGTGITRDGFHEPRDETGAANFTFVNNFRIIGKGDAPSFLAHDVVHVTVNANGDITAEIEHVGAECK